MSCGIIKHQKATTQQSPDAWLYSIFILFWMAAASLLSSPAIFAASSPWSPRDGLPGLMLLLNGTSSKPLSMVTPYVNEADIQEIRSGFSTSKLSPPWGYVHDGFDIYPSPTGNLKPYQAVCSGRVSWIYTGDEQVIIWLECNSTYTVEINFETQAPNTGSIQLANIVVTEGQQLSQGDLIGYHYAPNDKSHVHFSLYTNWLTSCPESHFTQQARDSMLNRIHVLYPGALMCYGADPAPPPLYTPYENEADMAAVNPAFSSAGSGAPWGVQHGGLDIYPQGDLKSFQAACPGTIDKLELRQNSNDNNWEVEILIKCDEYVADPDNGGYFIPYSAVYIFQPMSTSPADGLAQFADIAVMQGQHVSQGDHIGYLDTPDPTAHVHFGVEMFASSFFAALGAQSIPICPKPHFSSAAAASVLDLLHVSWPLASMCY